MNPVLVTLHHEPEGWWADSLSVPGWSAAADTLAGLRSLILDGVRFALGDDRVNVREVLDAPPSHGGVVFDFIKDQANTISVRSSTAVGVTC